MKIIYEPTKIYKFALVFEFSQSMLSFCRLVKEKYGWQNFLFLNRKWRFSSTDILGYIVSKYPDIEIDKKTNKAIIEQQLLEIEKAKQEKEIALIKNKKDSDIVVKGIKGELFPYQRVGVEFFVKSNGKSILADTQGLGKTVQALAYICHSKKEKTLIICPASVKYSWEVEIDKWTNLKKFIINSKEGLTPEIIEENDLFLINYDIIKIFFDVEVKEVYNAQKGKREKKKKFKLKSLFKLFNFDCIVVDEFHYIKNSSTQRTKMVRTLSLQTDSLLLMSGTPILNKPVELFNGLNLIDPQTWNDWYVFTKRYCNGHQGRYGWDYNGSSNLDELQRRISKYFLRRLKSDIDTDLPPKRRIDIPVEIDPDNREKYRTAEESFKEYLREYKNASDKKIASAMRAEQLGKLNALRQITSLGKVEFAKELLQSIVDSGEKTVVFSTYNEPIEILKNHFKKISVAITGKTSMDDRREAIKNFQNNSDIKLFFGGMKSAGTGITLTAGQNVVFIDYAWVPADHEQAEDRIHRHGQKAKSVTIYQLYAKDTIDEKMKEILVGKRKIFNKLIENNNIVEESKESFSLVNDLLKTF